MPVDDSMVVNVAPGGVWKAVSVMLLDVLVFVAFTTKLTVEPMVALTALGSVSDGASRWKTMNWSVAYIGL